MTTDLLEILELVSVAVYSGVALAALRLHLRVRSSSSQWLLLTFVALAAVVVGARLLPDATPVSAAAVRVARDVLIVVLLFFPYALYRFASGFRSHDRALDVAVHVALGLLVVATFVLPPLPEERGDFTPAMQGYLFGVLLYWTALSAWIAVGLWRGGRKQPGVARRRMQMLSIGTLVLNVALLLAGLVGDADPAVQVVTTLLGWTSALLFLLGFAPPGALRHAWRQPDERRLRRAEASLMTATSAQEVASTIVPHVAELLGGHGAALLDRDGEPLAAQGFSAAQLRDATSDREHVMTPDRVILPLQAGSLVVQASVYAPFFGEEEQELLLRWARSSTWRWRA